MLMRLHPDEWRKAVCRLGVAGQVRVLRSAITDGASLESSNAFCTERPGPARVLDRRRSVIFAQRPAAASEDIVEQVAFVATILFAMGFARQRSLAGPSGPRLMLFRFPAVCTRAQPKPKSELANHAFAINGGLRFGRRVPCATFALGGLRHASVCAETRRQGGAALIQATLPAEHHRIMVSHDLLATHDAEVSPRPKRY